MPDVTEQNLTHVVLDRWKGDTGPAPAPLPPYLETDAVYGESASDRRLR
jgi:hypothetical protein